MKTTDELYDAYVCRLDYIFATTDSVKELRDAYKLLFKHYEYEEEIKEEDEKLLARLEELKNKIKAKREEDE
ncbi:hypothetical protein DT144_12080 [Salmonella enterica subsp. enterica]|nr:hypothetical protein [Salmonella enterica subsp. enterica]